MTARSARWLVVIWGAAYVVFLSWPALVPFNRIEPRILGMPFVMAFVAGWLVLGLVVLLIVDSVIAREEPDNDGGGQPQPGPSGPSSH